MGAIVIDARDAAGSQLRGLGRYARELVSALAAQASAKLPVVAVGALGCRGCRLRGARGRH